MYRLPFDVSPTTYDEALATLHSALRFGICPMLESVEESGDDCLASGKVLRDPPELRREWILEHCCLRLRHCALDSLAILCRDFTAFYSL